MILYVTGSIGRITPNDLPLQRSLESTSTNASDTMSTGNVNEVAHINTDHVPAVPHTVINSTTPDLPSDTSPVTSNGMCVHMYNLLIVIHHFYQLK